jgi:hypothetical protein
MCQRSQVAQSSVVALAFALLATTVGSAVAEEPSLDIELNKIEDSADGCRSVFVFGNHTGHDLNRFRVDLILFDPEGVYAKQLLLDMAPLYAEKKTVASFLLGEEPCGSIGSILVNDVPWCENGTGSSIDCVRLLEVNSKAELPLQK